MYERIGGAVQGKRVLVGKRGYTRGKNQKGENPNLSRGKGEKEGY